MPALVLLVLAVPSFSLLYSLDELLDPVITVKAIGRQWYWSYELGDYSNEDGDNIAFDSYLIAEDELQEGHLRMLEVDQRLVLPTQTHIRVIVTSSDVLHCFAVPSFGIKIDACPGRLNQTSVFIKREGVYYGNCSELCGSRHAFMPIVVQAVNLNTYSN
jgi:cytochrome c oxidase subunit 2